MSLRLLALGFENLSQRPQRLINRMRRFENLGNIRVKQNKIGPALIFSGVFTPCAFAEIVFFSHSNPYVFILAEFVLVSFISCGFTGTYNTNDILMVRMHNHKNPAFGRSSNGNKPVFAD
jgi:hypothetical protein